MPFLLVYLKAATQRKAAMHFLTSITTTRQNLEKIQELQDCQFTAYESVHDVGFPVRCTNLGQHLSQVLSLTEQ